MATPSNPSKPPEDPKDQAETGKQVVKKTIKVRATAAGQFGRYRNRGDVFEVEEKNLASWMEPVDPADAKRLEAVLLKLNDGRPPAKLINVPATPVYARPQR